MHRCILVEACSIDKSELLPVKTDWAWGNRCYNYSFLKNGWICFEGKPWWLTIFGILALALARCNWLKWSWILKPMINCFDSWTLNIWWEGSTVFLCFINVVNYSVLVSFCKKMDCINVYFFYLILGSRSLGQRRDQRWGKVQFIHFFFLFMGILTKS